MGVGVFVGVFVCKGNVVFAFLSFSILGSYNYNLNTLIAFCNS